MSEHTTPGCRSAAEVRRDGNHLQQESSLHLKQHAAGPVDWYPWGEEALARARDENKPIFVSVGYAASLMCRLMQTEVFGDDRLADVLNANFINIKIDRDQRPDLDEVCVDAVRIISSQAGWPLTLFLTPELKPFFGGTLFPPEQFGQLVDKIKSLFEENRAEIDEQAAVVGARVAELPPQVGIATDDKPVSEQMIATAAAQAGANIDRKWGGFKGDQKYPTPLRWRFLLHNFRCKGDKLSVNLMEQTLESMACSGIYDHVGGGFHRNSLEKTWLIPQFEKLLTDNAQLAALYTEAGAVRERADLLAVGRDILGFVLREMVTEDGLFCSAIDAFSCDEDGGYYLWTPDDLTIATNADDGPLLGEMLGVLRIGNFAEGSKSVISRRVDPREVAAETEQELDLLLGLWGKHRENLVRYRAKRTPPILDRKIVTSANGLMISALAEAFLVAGNHRYLEAATTAADQLWKLHHRGEGQLWHQSEEGRCSIDAVLADYAMLAVGLLDLHQATGEPVHLERAVQLIDYTRAHFARPEGAWFMVSDETDAPMGRKVNFLETLIPADNSVMVHAVLRAAALTGRNDLRADADRAMAAFKSGMSQLGLEMGWWNDAALLANGPLYTVVIAGEPGAVTTRALVGSVLRDLPQQAVVLRVPAEGPDETLAALAPITAGRTADGDSARAWVFEGDKECGLTSDPQELKALINTGWHC